MTGQSPGDHEVSRLLEEYLSGLQSGEHLDRDELLRQHPELAPTLECLEMLERIAVDLSAGDPAQDVPPSSDNTIAFSKSTTERSGEFGAYELLEEIGRGGMGVVYKARQRDLDRTVAIKMILAGHLASPEHVRRFQAEAKAAAGLRHPNVVDIHEVGQLHGQHYFAMDYIDGESLAERVAQRPVGMSESVRMMAQVARAVAHLHNHQIVHRDLKPSNILLDSDEQPYVTDFGLAKMFANSDETASGAILGTASYMSPEQAAGRSADVGPPSDVYSLGCILYELLTGRPPFAEANPLDTLMQVLTREPTLPRQLNRKIPRSLELICLKCLSKSPDDRYQSADGLANDLERFLKGETLSARPPHPAQRAWNWARREPATAARLSGLGIFFVVHTSNSLWGDLLPEFKQQMYVLIAFWAVTTIGCHHLLKLERWSIHARFVWGTLDSILLLATLFIGSGVASALVVLYPMLIVASGLWFQVRFVWFMTAMSLASYGVHVIDYFQRRTDLHSQTFDRADRHVIFAVMLVAVGWAVAYLVQRVRDLSRYYGQKR